MTISSIKAVGRSFAVCAMKRSGGFASAFLAVTIAGLVVPDSAMAKELHVYSETVNGMTGNQQLTNAFIQAQSGDTITIHKGTYNLATEELVFRNETDANGTLHATDGICLYSEVDNLTVQGDPLSSRDEIILSGQGDKTAGDGKHAIMKLKGRNCIVRNLTFRKGFANYDYKVYKAGVHINNGDQWDTRRGGGLYQRNSSVCSNCVFESCYAGQGAAICGGVIRDCDILSCNAVANNAGCSVFNVVSIYDSMFDNNGRGAIFECSTVISNCTFKNNRHVKGSYAISGLLWKIKAAIIDCDFIDNESLCVNLERNGFIPAEIRDCTFTNNVDSAVYPGRAAIAGTYACTAPIVNCTFSGSGQLLYNCQMISNCTFACGKSGGTVSNCAVIVDSRFFGDGKTLTGSADVPVAVVDNCSLIRCSFSDYSVRWGFLFRNVPFMRNCLVTGGAYWGGGSGFLFRYSNGKDAIIENCTIADAGPINAMYYNDSGAGTIIFRNTLFHNNKVGGQSWGKFDFYADTSLATPEVLTAGLKMENTIFRAGNNSAKSDILAVGCENLLGKSYNPMFLKDKYVNTIHEHPYALHRSSPCIDKGSNDGWMANDIDLAGNKRLNGIVDIGCYENWYVAPGLKVIFR